MTVANAAATIARNSETGTKPSALELGLDSIVLLKTQGKFSVKSIVSPSSFLGCLESSPSEGERWLRRAAQDGDLYAMGKLGRRLLTGDGLPRSIEEGRGWFKKSAEVGNPFAMERLAECELDENETPGSSAEAERWLRSVEPGVRFPESCLLMPQCLVMKRSDREIQKAFSDQYATEHIPNIKSRLGELSAGLQNSWLLEPAFQN